MKEIVKKEEVLDITIITLEDCIIKYNSGIQMRNEAIYESSLLTDKEAKEFQIKVGISNSTVYYAISHEQAKIDLSYQHVENLNKTENCLSLPYSTFLRLSGKTTRDREYNFQEVLTAKGSTPNSLEIEIFNSLKSHARNGAELEMINPIYTAILDKSFSLKSRFSKSKGSKYTILKLFNLLPLNADESVWTGLADTGNLIATKSSKADREEIARLEEEIALLKRRITFFEQESAITKVRKFLKIIDYTVNSLKKVGGDKKLMDALALLGVDATVNEIELKKAYKEQVSIHHTDIGGDASILVSIIEANTTLKEHIKRITNG